MTTVLTGVQCRAADPTTCRFHGTARTDFETRAIERVETLRTELEGTLSLQRREEAETELRDAEVNYAATLTGEQDLRRQLENADWMEQERLTQQLEEGVDLRERLEAAQNDPTTITFPASRLQEAEARIAKANRKLERSGIEERFTFTTEEFVETHEDGSRYQMIRLTLNTPTIKENGWQFIASVDKAADGTPLTRVIPGQELNGYRPDSMLCEHCGSRRHRKTTYLVKNAQGEYKQVGSNCLESFLGVRPRGLWALNFDPQEDGNLIDAEGRIHRSSADRLIPTEDAVAIALAASEGGERFITASRARDTGQTSTSQEVSSYLFNSRSNGPDYDVDAFRDRAKEIINSTAFTGNSDYETNMRTLMNQEDITPRQLGMVVSVISANRRQQVQQERAERPRSVGYVAPVGETVSNVPAKVKRIRSFTSDYGYPPKTGTIFILTTPDNQEIKWATTSSNDTLSALNENDEVIIAKMKVKKHSSFNEDDQTIVSNVKMEKNVLGDGNVADL